MEGEFHLSLSGVSRQDTHTFSEVPDPTVVSHLSSFFSPSHSIFFRETALSPFHVVLSLLVILLTSKSPREGT
jgi:hypothetical protein